MIISTRTASIYNIFLFLTVIFFLSCEPKDDTDLVPSYLHIEKIDVTSTYQQGTSSSKITDAWVYIDGTLIGSYELPATIPILTEGKQNVSIYAGIKLNGISNTRSAYPFYSPIVREINFVRDSVINLGNLNVGYHPSAIFPWLEDFNISGISLDTTSKSTVAIAKTDNPEYLFPESDNPYCGIVQLTADSAIFEAATIEKFEFPANGGSVFLEMNYKINHPIIVGVIYMASGLRVQRPLYGLNKSEEWNKAYINLSVIKYDTPSATDFQIFFGAQKEDGSDDVLFLLDNLKLVHFNTSK